MGLDVYSYAVYGKVVPKEQILTRTKIRTCHHATDESKKFCSECGKPVWQETESVVLDSMENELLSYFYSDYENQQEVIVGFLLRRTESSRAGSNTLFCKLKQPTSIMTAEIINFFAEHGIEINSDQLDTYIFQYYSY